MSINKLFWVLILACIVNTITVYSSNHYFRRIDVSHGLSQNNVKSICQDSRGFMWFGTRNKLNRYDGVSIKVYDVVDKNKVITNNNIGALSEDLNQNLWIGTDKGVFIFDPLYESFQFFDVRTKDGVQITEWVSDIRTDADGNIWIVIPAQGLFLYREEERDLIYFAIGSYNEPDQGNPQCIFIGGDNSVWIGTNGAGIYLYDKSKNSFKQFLGDSFGSNTLIGQNIYTICDYGEELAVGVHEGKLLKLHKRKNVLSEFKSKEINYKIIRHLNYINNHLWVGTQHGLFIIDEEGNTQHLEESYSDPYSLSNNVVEKIYQDREGGVWIGTYSGGLSYFPNQGTHIEKYFPTHDKGSISSKRVTILSEDYLKRVWVGTEDGGVNIFHPEEKKFSLMQSDDKLTNQRVVSILLQQDKAWIGYFKNGIDIQMLSGDFLKHFSSEDLNLSEATPFALCEDRHGNIWLGCMSSN